MGSWRPGHCSFYTEPKQELTELPLLPAEATHTQGKAVTLFHVSRSLCSQQILKKKSYFYLTRKYTDCD